MRSRKMIRNMAALADATRQADSATDGMAAASE